MSDPPSIKRLDDAVVNRIAAGEVIQRPANALKELIENSIDAKSTNVQVVLKEGGLKFLQITDNGIGIKKEDFGIVCERFTTSKLEKFEDLNSISTYGFRGEALASISHVAHLTIQSKTANSDCAYRASYVDSKLKDAPKPCAGNQGTTITVEDLFYNMSTRKRALKNSGEEFRKISDVVSKYAVHNPTVGFGLKKFGENNCIKTSPESNHVDNIRIIYGNGIARELMETSMRDQSLKFEMKACFTNVNYSTKKGIFLLFINHRLVESAAVKKGVDQIYSTYLPKNAHPFVYLSLQIDPQNVDVNVHPTKHEVHFLHEEQIIEKICGHLESKLLGCNSSRIFYTQAKLPGASEKIEFADGKANQTVNRDDKNMVRTDGSDQKLDKFLRAVAGSEGASQLILDTSLTQQAATSSRMETRLHSVLSLRDEIERKCHETLRKLISEHVFVGCVDSKRCLLQHGTKLYLCRTDLMAEQLFYQIILYNFGNFGTISFPPDGLRLRELLTLSLDDPESGWTPEEGAKEELAARAAEILLEKAEMLEEYFALKVDGGREAGGSLVTVPLLIEEHAPDPAGLPMYLLRLATEVDWDHEKNCFRTFARETARYYSRPSQSDEDWKRKVEHVLCPAIKKYLLPPKDFADNASVLQLTDLPALYKVFERC